MTNNVLTVFKHQNRATLATPQVSKTRTIIIVGLTIGAATDMLTELDEALSDAEVTGVVVSVHLANWTSDVYRFRGFDRETTAFIKAGDVPFGRQGGSLVDHLKAQYTYLANHGEAVSFCSK